MIEIIATNPPAHMVVEGITWQLDQRFHLNVYLSRFSLTRLVVWRCMATDNCRMLVTTLCPGYTLSPTLCLAKYVNPGRSVFAIHFIAKRRIKVSAGMYSIIIGLGMHREN